MKLSSKLVILILTLWIVVFIGTFTITIHTTRTFFIEQLNSNARDTATSLGLSLSHALHDEDRALMLSMVQAVFNRGYFREVKVVSLDGKELVSRRQSPDVASPVPNWFQQILPLRASTQHSIVMRGWRQLGRVEVTTDPAWALKALWDSTKAMFWWFLSISIIALIGLLLFMRQILLPLKRITDQAKGICRREFTVQDTMPRTQEFRQVTEAMNKMVVRVQSIFDSQLAQIRQLRTQSYQDALTGLSNRRLFLQELQSTLQREDEFVPGSLALIAIDGLEVYNRQQGYQEGDELIQAISLELKAVTAPYRAVSAMRIGGSQFALIIKYLEYNQLQDLAKNLNIALQKLVHDNPICQLQLAIVDYHQYERIGELLARADQILNQARNSSDHLFISSEIQQDYIGVTREELQEALARQYFHLFSQAVYQKQHVYHEEIYIRLQRDGELVPAGFFMNYAEKEKYASAIDCYLLDRIQENQYTEHRSLAINISGQTLLDDINEHHFIRKLEQLPLSVRHYLALEIQETYVLNNYTAAAEFIKTVNKLGVHVGIDHVGLHFNSLEYLKDLPIQYIKVDGFLLQDLINNDYKQFYLNYFNELAKTMDVRLIATQIESEDQLALLKKIGITLYQGNKIANTQPLQ